MDRYLPVVVIILLQTNVDGGHADLHVKLKRRRLQSVPSDIQPLTESLDLSFNLLKTIPDDAFVNLTSLTFLDLSHNRLESLQPRAFRGLAKLLSLNLNHNNLQLTYEDYPPNVFRPLHLLKTLTMAYNANTDRKDLPNGYPDELFGSLGSVTRLAIDAVDGLPFGPGLLHMSQLKSLQANLRTTAGATSNETLAVFANLSIESLEVESSRLARGSLTHFPDLKNLMIKTDGLNRALSALADVRYKNFTSLSLSYCNTDIRSRLDPDNLIITSRNHAHLSTLCVQHLDLSNNYIIHFDLKALLDVKYPECYESLNLGENYLVIATALLTFTGLSRFANLRYLNVSPGKTYYMPVGMPSPTDTNQGNLSLTSTIHLTISLPPSLQTLNVSFIGSSEFPTAIVTFQMANRLQVVDLAFTQPVGCFLIASGLQSVQVLNISGTDCSVINPKFFDSFPGLHILVAQNSRLSEGFERDSYGTAFRSLKFLKTLDLSNNDLTTLHRDLFKPLLNLETLILRNNKLTAIPMALFDVGTLRYLDISRNVLSSLSTEEMHWLTLVFSSKRNDSVTVSLGGNVFLCTCNTLTFVHWVLEHPHNIGNGTLSCSMQNGTVTDIWGLKTLIKDMDVRCVSKFWLTFSVVGSCLLTLSIILAILGYRFRWNIKYWIRTKCRRGPLYDEMAMEHYQFDAFVAYNYNNYQWACIVLRNVLEIENNYTLCLHDRDFPVGVSIQQNIVDAVNNSRKVILVINRAFLRSEWFEFEIQMAGMRMLRDGRENAIIVIMMEEIPVAEMPRSLLNLWKNITFLLWENGQTDEEIFWGRLLEVMERP